LLQAVAVIKVIIRIDSVVKVERFRIGRIFVIATPILPSSMGLS